MKNYLKFYRVCSAKIITTSCFNYLLFYLLFTKFEYNTYKQYKNNIFLILNILEIVWYLKFFSKSKRKTKIVKLYAANQKKNVGTSRMIFDKR